MASTADIVREQEAGLALLFQRGLELALRIQEDAMAAETAAERAALATSFHRVARGVRQTAALRTKLAGDARRAERDEAAEVVRLDQVRVARRQDQVRAAVHRLIWTEADSEDALDDLKAELEEVLDAEALDEAFAAEPLEAQVARVCEALGLAHPSPVAGEGRGPGSRPATTDEGSRGGSLPCPEPIRPADPLTRPAGAEHGLRPQAEEDDDYWRSSA